MGHPVCVCVSVYDGSSHSAGICKLFVAGYSSLSHQSVHYLRG